MLAQIKIRMAQELQVSLTSDIPIVVCVIKFFFIIIFFYQDGSFIFSS
jgi:hypothetical protein